MTFTSLDRLNKAIATMHAAGLGKIESITILRDVALGFGTHVTLGEAKTLIDAIWNVNGWKSATLPE